MSIQSSEWYDEWDVLLNDVYQYLKITQSSSDLESIESDEVARIKVKEVAVQETMKEYTGGSRNTDNPIIMSNFTAIIFTKDRCNYLISLRLKNQIERMLMKEPLYEIVGRMNNGAKCTVFTDKTKNGWYFVEYNGVYGYASGNCID